MTRVLNTAAVGKRDGTSALKKMHEWIRRIVVAFEYEVRIFFQHGFDPLTVPWTRRVFTLLL